MLNSVAEFYDEDVATRTTAVLSLIEPAIMIFMGIFVAFVLVALYLPIFSLAGSMAVMNGALKQSESILRMRNKRKLERLRRGIAASSSICKKRASTRTCSAPFRWI